MKFRKLIFCICISIIFSFTGCSSVQDSIKNLKNDLNEVKLSSFSPDLNGIWNTELEDGTDLSIIIDSENEKIYLTSKKEGCSYYPLRGVEISDGKLCFSIPRKSSNINFELALTKDKKLIGNSKYYDDNEDVLLEKIGDNYTVEEAQTSEFEYSYKELQNLIKENSKYKDDNLDYEFSYELGNKDSIEEIIEKYNLDEVTKDKKDVELMELLLNWECDLLDHSSTNIADKKDIKSLIEDGLKNGTQCTGLSLILAEVLRAYGIKAQAIQCLPYVNIYNDCHVVVNAYSEELKQWIMLDPTYRLILKDESGKYVSVQDLRENIKNDVKMIRNDNAGYNEEKMTDTGFQDYLKYMAKNSCRYIKAEENYDDSIGTEDNIKIELVSNNYEEPKDWSKEYNQIVTTNAEKFWEN